MPVSIDSSSMPPQASVGEAPDAVAPAAPRTPFAPVTMLAVPKREIGGPAGPEPTRFGDWEKSGRCIDF